MKKWLPTALLLACAAVLAALFVSIRVLLGAVFPVPAQAPAGLEITVAVPEAGLAPIAVQPAVPAPVVESPPPPRIRFASRVVEPTYVVVPGDNLWSIAQRHGTTTEAIQAINNLPERPILSVGQRLVLP